jgi:hypothetical protein
MPTDSILIRSATAADTPAIEHLAALDSSPVPAGDLLVAEVAGQVRAALRIADHAVIADPFEPTAGLISLLAARADQFTGGPGARTRLAHWSHLWHRATVLRPTV